MNFGKRLNYHWVVSNNFHMEYPTISVHHTRKEARKEKKVLKKVRVGWGLEINDVKMFKLVEVR